MGQACRERLFTDTRLDSTYNHMREVLRDDLPAWREFLSAVLSSASAATEATQIRKARAALRKKLRGVVKYLRKIDSALDRCQQLAGQGKVALPPEPFEAIRRAPGALLRYPTTSSGDRLLDIALQSRKNSEDHAFVRCLDAQLQSPALCALRLNAAQMAPIVMAALGTNPGVHSPDVIEAYARTVRSARRNLVIRAPKSIPNNEVKNVSRLVKLMNLRRGNEVN